MLARAAVGIVPLFPQLPRLRPQFAGPVRYAYDRLAVDALPLRQRITARAGAPMAETDSLLKRLVSTCILDFATWLLRAPVRTARPLQSELPGSTVAVDQVFQIT